MTLLSPNHNYAADECIAQVHIPSSEEKIRASERFDKNVLVAAHLAALHDAYILEMGTHPINESLVTPVSPTSSIGGLKSVPLKQLKIGKVHHRRVLHGTLCTKTMCTKGLNGLVVVNVLEDEEGNATPICLSNALKENCGSAQAQRLFPQGSRVAVREPYLTRYPDGEVGLLVEKPADLVFLWVPEVVASANGDAKQEQEQEETPRANGHGGEGGDEAQEEAGSDEAQEDGASEGEEEEWEATRELKFEDDMEAEKKETEKQEMEAEKKKETEKKVAEQAAENNIEDDEDEDEDEEDDNIGQDELGLAEVEQRGVAQPDLESSASLRARGNGFFARGAYATAAELYTLAAARASVAAEEALALSNRAETWLRVRNNERALADARAALSALGAEEGGQLSRAKSLFREGRALMGLKRYAEAAEVLQKVVESHPSDRQLREAAAQCKARAAQLLKPSKKQRAAKKKQLHA